MIKLGSRQVQDSKQRSKRLAGKPAPGLACRIQCGNCQFELVCVCVCVSVFLGYLFCLILAHSDFVFDPWSYDSRFFWVIGPPVYETVALFNPESTMQPMSSTFLATLSSLHTWVDAAGTWGATRGGGIIRPCRKINFGAAAGTHMVQLATKRLGTYSHKNTMSAPLFAKVYMVHHACFMIQGFKSTRFKLVPFQKKKLVFKVRL